VEKEILATFVVGPCGCREWCTVGLRLSVGLFSTEQIVPGSWFPCLVEFLLSLETISLVKVVVCLELDRDQICRPFASSEYRCRYDALFTFELALASIETGYNPLLSCELVIFAQSSAVSAAVKSISGVELTRSLW